MFTIKVIVRTTGKPAYYKRVGVVFEGLFRGSSRDCYTDKNGEAHFTEDNGRGKVYVNGRECHNGKIEGRIVVYIDD
jgi:hypothetical protein